MKKTVIGSIAGVALAGIGAAATLYFKSKKSTPSDEEIIVAESEKVTNLYEKRYEENIAAN